MFSKLLLILPLLYFSKEAAATCDLTVVQAASSVQNTNGNNDSRFFYQDRSGRILQTGLTERFDIGASVGAALIAPSNEVLPCTPIAATTGENFHNFSVYFLSRDRILSEYYWNGTQFNGGPTCRDCLTASGFKAADNSNALYVTQNPVTGVIGVGFISSGAPGTVSEAVKRNGRWVVAPYPGQLV